MYAKFIVCIIYNSYKEYFLDPRNCFWGCWGPKSQGLQLTVAELVPTAAGAEPEGELGGVDQIACEHGPVHEGQEAAAVGVHLDEGVGLARVEQLVLEEAGRVRLPVHLRPRKLIADLTQS